MAPNVAIATGIRAFEGDGGTASENSTVIGEQPEYTARFRLHLIDTIVASLVERVEAEGTGSEARTRFYRLMTSLAAALPAIHEMGITDEQGNAIVKSLRPDPTGLNYAEREYFKFHAAHQDRGPFIRARIKSKIDGTYNITVTRRINRSDGSFAGVVVTSVSMKYFQNLFEGSATATPLGLQTVADASPFTYVVTSTAGRDGTRLQPYRFLAGLGLETPPRSTANSPCCRCRPHENRWKSPAPIVVDQ